MKVHLLAQDQWLPIPIEEAWDAQMIEDKVKDLENLAQKSQSRQRTGLFVFSLALFLKLLV